VITCPLPRHDRVVVSCVEPDTVVLSKSYGTNSTQNLGFRQLYRAHFDHVMRLILRFGIDTHDAEDLAQRVFLIAYRRCDLAEPLERPEAWLRAVVVRIVREHFRWWRVRRAASWLVAHSWAGRTEDEQSPERDALTEESLRQVSHVLYQMSEKLREALVLLDIDGLTPREGAELLGVPQNTLRSRRAMAREEFKRLWLRLPERRDRADV
jgi:RNA polymerase sigma-70 factor, ECF subfamily